MTDDLLRPTLILREGKSVPSIEVDVGDLNQERDEEIWKETALFTAVWVKQAEYTKSATVWGKIIPSINFGHESTSLLLACYGVPKSFLLGLHDRLTRNTALRVRYSDYVQPRPDTDWSGLVHVERGYAWLPVADSRWCPIG